MAYKELQGACKEAGLSAGGSSGVLLKRLRAVSMKSEARQGGDAAVDDVQEPPPKRQKKASDDLICPILLELPLDPVTAKDGRVYERSGIEQHISKAKSPESLKSPITRAFMGMRLFPAIEHKNLIQTLIDNSVITGELADSWNEKVEEANLEEELFKLAESGESDAMVEVGFRYKKVNSGFKQDYEKAVFWYKRAHDVGEIAATANLGYFLLTGRGVKNAKKMA